MLRIRKGHVEVYDRRGLHSDHVHGSRGRILIRKPRGVQFSALCFAPFGSFAHVDVFGGALESLTRGSNRRAKPPTRGSDSGSFDRRCSGF